MRQANVGRLIDEEKSIPDGAVAGWNQILVEYHGAALRAAAAHYGFALDLSCPVKAFTPPQRDLLLFGVESPQFRRHFPAIEPPATVRRERFEGVVTALLRRDAEHGQEREYREKLGDLLLTAVCPDCAGTRLRPESRAVTVNGESIIALSRLPLDELCAWLDALPTTFGPDEHTIADPVLLALGAGIARLVEVGAGYLALERATPTLSAGEAQRLRLAPTESAEP